MQNELIRATAKQSGVKLWEIAEYCGVTDSTFSRKMRRELPKEAQDVILKAIQQIADRRGGTNNAPNANN